MEQHHKLMKMAIRLSESNVLNHSAEPFGAVIAKNGKVIAKSANLVRKTNDPTAHAEIAAIRLACKKLKTFDLSGCILYTSCEPCPMCLAAIYWAKIDAIYYANTKQDAASAHFDDQMLYQELLRPLSQRKLPIKQLLRDEAIHAFRLWEEQQPVNQVR